MTKIEKNIIKIVEIETAWWPPCRSRIAAVLREHFATTISLPKLSSLLRRMRRHGDLICDQTLYFPSNP